MMSDDRFYTVYVEDASGLFNNNNMAVHGLIGKWPVACSLMIQVSYKHCRLLICNHIELSVLKL